MTVDRTQSLIGALACLVLAGCIKTTERLEFQKDGRVKVKVTADGSLDDLSDGYPVPLGGGWTPASDDARAWITKFGTSAPSVKADPAHPREPWRDEKGAVRGNIILTSESEFESAAHLPTEYAPDDEPYASAHFLRSTHLEIRKMDGRTVYVFERVFQGRKSEITEAWKTLKANCKGPGEKLVQGLPFTAEDRATALAELRSALQKSANWYVRESLGALYTEGDASVSLATRKLILDQSVAAVRRFLTGPLLEEVLDEIDRLAKETRRVTVYPAPPRPPSPFERLETEFRNCVRGAFTEALTGSEVPAGIRNGILSRFEWLITGEDVTVDLADEDFTIEVVLPGRLVSGNYQSESGRAAVWTFKGEALKEGPVLLRAVSVLE